MWNKLQSLFRQVPDRAPTTATRPARFRPTVERLESRALLSVAPTGIDWFAIGTSGDAVSKLPTAQDVSISISYNGKFQLPTDVLAGGPSRGSVSDPHIIDYTPTEPSKDGGMIDVGDFDKADYGQLYSGEMTEPAQTGVSEALPALQYAPRIAPLNAAVLPGGALYGDTTVRSSNNFQLSPQRDAAQATTERLDPAFKSVPNGQSEKAAAEIQHGVTSPTTTTDATAKTHDDDADGGMVVLQREPVVDEAAEGATAAEDADSATLEVPRQVERSYGRFQAFEVSTAEEIGIGPGLSDTTQTSSATDLPSENQEESFTALPAAGTHEAAVDELFALAATVDELLDHDISGDTHVEEAPPADIPLSKSELKSTEAHDESTASSRGFASLPVSSVAAAVLFASVTRATRRPRPRDEENAADPRD